MKNILIIGGTRNIGYYLSRHLDEAGHAVTLLNRGVTPDDLPRHIPRLRCDRTDRQQMRHALVDRHFDVVIDMAVYKENEAQMMVDLLSGRVGHYIAISSGQVYLVRDGVERPYSESDYDGALIYPPKPNTYDYEEWLYGMNKRDVEDVLFNAHAKDNFPMTTLRLPMVNSERDSFRRLYGYILRVRDGGPILVPETPDHPLRHVYGGDVVNAVNALIDSGKGKGQAFNITQDETVSISDFIALLAQIVGKPAEVKFVPRPVLEAHGFLPDCSPFSDLWMSELDNTLSKTELGVTYTPLADYLARIVAYHEETATEPPVSYRRRPSEKKLGREGWE